MRFSISTVLFTMLALGGTLFLFIGWREWNSTLRILHNGVQTQGIIVENVQRPRRTGEVQSTAQAPVVRFVTVEGRQVDFYSQLYTTPATYAVGSAVEIWYLPDDPHQATLKGADAWVLPLVFGIFGLAMCLIGYPVLLRGLFFSKS